MGAAVSLAGAALTIVLNIWWIPLLGYVGSAWATLACYGSMAIASYLLGQKYYPVDYDVKRVIGYIGLGLGLYYAHGQLLMSLAWYWQPWLLACALMLIYILTTVLFERRQNAGATVFARNE